MNAYTSKEELALLSNHSRLSHAEHYRAASPQPSVFGRITAFFERHAVLNELRQLTDRELADIGLQRAELSRVFDPAFMAGRDR